MTELASCLAPIDGGAGVDARFDAEHERIRAEIEKLNGIDGAQPAWDDVLRSGATLLRERSKDLAVASYVTAAALELHGLAGLADGLALLQGLTETFGDSVFPLRPRARSNALEWLLERASSRVEALPVEPEVLTRAEVARVARPRAAMRAPEGAAQASS